MPAARNSAAVVIPHVPNIAEETPPTPVHGDRSSGLIVVLGVLALAVVAALGSGYWLWAHPRVAFTNALPIPLLVRFGEAEAQLVGARQRLVLRVPRSTSAVTWRVPDKTFGVSTSYDLTSSEPLKFVLNPLTPVAISAGAKFGGQSFFIPLVTNTTSSPLQITGNAGVLREGRVIASQCQCTIPPGAVRQPAGIYPLLPESTLLSTDSDGKTAMFEHFSGQVNPLTGEVGLKFNSGNFKQLPPIPITQE